MKHDIVLYVWKVNLFCNLLLSMYGILKNSRMHCEKHSWLVRYGRREAVPFCFTLFCQYINKNLFRHYGFTWCFLQGTILYQKLNHKVKTCLYTFKYSLCPKINDLFDHWHVCQCTTLIVNIFNYLLLKIIKMIYFESTRRDKSNNISYANICMYILVEK
jgi:hypothetical protein